MGGIVTTFLVALTILVFYRVWVLSLRPVPVSWDQSSAYHWDLERPEKWITGHRVFDVRRAKQLIHETPRPVRLVDVTSIARSLDTGQTLIDLDQSDVTQIQLFFPLILVPEGSGVLIIDGWHRVALAIRDQVPTLRAVWLTETEKRQIESSSSHG